MDFLSQLGPLLPVTKFSEIPTEDENTVCSLKIVLTVCLNLLCLTPLPIVLVIQWLVTFKYIGNFYN